jgi:GDPmannose 4,6-dehydratase
LTGEITGLGVVRLLEAVRANAPDARFYQASSSEMFGRVDREPQDEQTPFHPRSPYGVAKVYAYWACVNYREAHDLFVSNGILFNHESERRGLEFLTRKVSHGVARIHAGLTKSLALGNLDAKRDWGYAPEYVDLMWRVLQHGEPDDFVGATGESHSVREFVAEAFRLAGISNWEKHVTMDDKNLRPSEVYNLRGDATKAKRLLGWEAKTRFKDLVRTMVEAEIRALEQARPAS